MIDVTEKKDCVGCNACVQRCPKQCINMHEDEQGFLYPKVDLGNCIHCNLCDRVCPVLNQAEPGNPIGTFAAKNLDNKVRMNSSSGGIFFDLAKNIIAEGGVVFGAKFNVKWEVVHDYADTLEGVRAFQGSKYVQSRIGDTYLKAEHFLKAGRKVMFTGTPCQIAALCLFLRKDYGEQLLKVDVVCHGVPSPLVWREYLKYITRPKGASDGKNTVLLSLNDKPVITGISFRDKRLGWEKYGFSARVAASYASGKNSVFQPVITEIEEKELLFESLDKNIFMQGFLKNLYLRPSCYNCPTKQLKSGSDISLADFWGINGIDSEVYDKNGVSLVLANTPKGLSIFQHITQCYKKESFEKAVAANTAIIHSCRLPKYYDKFWQDFAKNGIDVIMPIAKKIKPPFIRRFKRRMINKIKYIINLGKR